VRHGKWRTTLSLCACLLTGCSEAQKTDETVDGLDEAQQQLEPVVRASCDWVFGCCAEGEARLALGPFVEDADDCTQRVLDSLLSGNTSPLPLLSLGPAGDLLYVARTLELQHVALDAEAMAACVEHLKTRACNEAPPEEPPEHCTPGDDEPDEDLCRVEDLFIGSQDVGDECNPSVDVECAPGQRCVSFGADGVCARLAAEGDNCFEDQECAEPLICDYITGTCMTGSRLGEVCTFSDPENPVPGTERERCQSDLTCNPETMSCVEETCAPGSPCQVDYQCPQGYVCAQFRCREPGQAGAPCNRHEDCATELCDSLADTCVPRVVDGGACVQDLECVSGFCDVGLCASSVANGSPCPSFSSSECRDGYCDTMTDPAMPVCAAYADAGGACPLGIECNPDPDLQLVCWEMMCRAIPFPNGITCGSDAHCESGVCWMGVCEDGTPAGGACALDGTVKPCALEHFCKIEDELVGTGNCQRVGAPGETCESDAECWGGCDVSYGELVCDTTAPPGQAWCDAM
jgi:hypothetical protein